MKKTLLLMAMALPFVLISCGDDKDEPVTPEEHEYVDLGLPSGTLWATCNVGANTPEEYGDYFAWGETAPKEVYSWETYEWCNGSWNTLTNYCTNSEFGTEDNKTELEPENDAAYVNWGKSWRMPSPEQLQELLNNCIWTWTTLNGVNGQQVTGPNGASLFLPVAGGRFDNSLNGVGSWGGYWSRTLYYDDPDRAYSLEFSSSGGRHQVRGIRHLGFPVRAVRVSQN